MILTAIINKNNVSQGRRDISMLDLHKLAKERFGEIEKFMTDIMEKFADPDCYGLVFIR